MLVPFATTTSGAPFERPASDVRRRRRVTRTGIAAKVFNELRASRLPEASPSFAFSRSDRIRRRLIYYY